MQKFMRLCSLFAFLAVLQISVLAADAKDPVCRMTVDTDTTPYTFNLADKSFYFCSSSCLEAFTRSPAKYADLAERLGTGTTNGKQHAPAYSVELKTSPRPTATEPVVLDFAVRYAGSGKLVRDFELVHDKLVHLVLVSDDLSWFEHQHPKLGADGRFRLTWRFPRAGRYWLYTDFTPADGDNQIKRSELLILPRHGSNRTRSTAPAALIPDRNLSRKVGGYRISLQMQPRTITRGRAAILTYSIIDTQGRAVPNMQPWLGALGHLFAVSHDGRSVVHTHTLQGTEAPPRNGKLSFKLQLPRAGIYKVWAQFVHKNRVLTVPFTVRAADA